MKTLVTGATGLVGNNVVRLLLDRGQQVRVLIRSTSKQAPLAGLDVEIAQGDIRDSESVFRAFQGVDQVIHAAARVHIGWSQPDLAREVNVEGTRNVCAAALSAGARMVHVSSVDALGIRTMAEPADEETPPTNGVLCPYVVTKRGAEQVVLEHTAKGLNATIANPAYMIGPWDWTPSSGRMLLQVAKGRALIAPLGGNNYCDVRDVALGILTAAERGQVGRRYILGGESLTYFQAWRIFAEVTGARRPIVAARRPLLAVCGFAGDVWGKITGREPDVNSAATTISSQPRNFTNARAEAELGYRPRPVREAATTAWQWFQEHGYA